MAIIVPGWLTSVPEILLREHPLLIPECKPKERPRAILGAFLTGR